MSRKERVVKETTRERLDAMLPFKYLVDPKAITASMMLGYALVIWAGMSTYLDGAPRLNSVWSSFYESYWAGLLVVGGLLGLIATPRGLWFLERPAIVLVGTGLVAYSATLLELHRQGAPGNQQISLALAALTLVLLLTRWLRIKWAALDPSK